jgi:uncharacterized membrane protein
VRGLLEGARGQVEFNLPWMGWNLFLAFLPWAMSVFVFRPTRRVTLLWLYAAAVCVVFLPNAPYVLTDVIHLPSAVRFEQSRTVILAVILPMYGALFLLGFAAYVDALRRVSRFVVERHWLPHRWPIELAVHAVSAVAIYAGRIKRFNSWDLYARPGVVVRETLDALSRPRPLAGVLLTFVLLTALYGVVRPVFDYLMASAFGGVATPWGMLRGADVKNES